MPAGGRATSSRGTGPVPRTHHPRHAVAAARNPSAGSQADQLNRQELSQLQGTNPTTMNRMSVGGKATSGGQPVSAALTEHRQPAKQQDVATQCVFKVRAGIGISERLDHVFKIAALPRYRDVRVTCSGIAGRSQPPATAPGTLANGTWTVQGREIPGTRCGHWLVRLTNMQGSLSGVLSLARASVPIQNLALAPDGSFSGTTPAGVVGTTHARAYQVTGRFVGDTVHVTLETNLCPARHGVATRRP